MEDRKNEMFNKALNPSSGYDFNDFIGEFGIDVYIEMMSNFTEVNMVDDLDISKIGIKYINTSSNPDPEFATIGSSGFDLRANIDGPITLKVGERVLIPTGLKFELPTNFEIQIRPRSGLAYKHGVTVLNTPGTIDADYRGDVGVLLINHGDKDFVIQQGDRVAQGVIATVVGKTIVSLNKVETLTEETERGSGGFGSTGVK